MRAPLAFRRCLPALMLPLFAAAPLRPAPDDASAYVVYQYYSDASRTTQVGVCHINWHCVQGYHACSGTQTAYYTAQIISQC